MGILFDPKVHACPATSGWAATNEDRRVLGEMESELRYRTEELRLDQGAGPLYPSATMHALAGALHRCV
jgi:hypothetical protein